MNRAATLLGLAAFALAAPARADELPPWIVPEGPHPDTVALQMNPLAIAAGRFSATLEYVLQTHHAAVASPIYYWAFPGPADTFDGGGVEVGYRYYTGRRGTNGFFAGASFLFGDYRFKHSVPTLRGTDGSFFDGANETDFQSYGGAIDAGYKALLWDTFVVGAGIGAQYTVFTLQPDWTKSTREDLVYGSGLRPRVLLEAGGAF